MKNTQRILSKFDGITPGVLFTLLRKVGEKEGASFLILRVSRLFANFLQTYLTAPAPEV